MNIPFSQPHMNDADYMYAFQEVVMPIAYEFDPDLVIGNVRIVEYRVKLMVYSLCWL